MAQPGHHIQVQRNMSKMCESYLTNRTQKICLGNKLSELANVACGVPQGSILVLSLFLVFINDLPLFLQSSSVVD